jgi:hypothetical protein
MAHRSGVVARPLGGAAWVRARAAAVGQAAHMDSRRLGRRDAGGAARRPTPAPTVARLRTRVQHHHPNGTTDCDWRAARGGGLLRLLPVGLAVRRAPRAKTHPAARAGAVRDRVVAEPADRAAAAGRARAGSERAHQRPHGETRPACATCLRRHAALRGLHLRAVANRRRAVHCAGGVAVAHRSVRQHEVRPSPKRVRPHGGRVAADSVAARRRARAGGRQHAHAQTRSNWYWTPTYAFGRRCPTHAWCLRRAT